MIGSWVSKETAWRKKVTGRRKIEERKRACAQIWNWEKAMRTRRGEMNSWGEDEKSKRGIEKTIR